MRRNAICLVVVVVATGLVWWGTVVRRPRVSQADNPFAVVPTGTRPSSRSDFSTVTTQEGTVRLRISGVDGPGPLFVAVFDSEQDFPNHHYAMRTLKVVPVDETTEVVLKDLDDASLAVAAFQDQDGNGKLTKGLLGVPVEPHGFSNNARGTFAAPKFSAAVFSVEDQRRIMEIRLVTRSWEASPD